MKRNIIKIIVKIINWFNPNYFSTLSYDRLEKYGIDDIVNGKVVFKK